MVPLAKPFGVGEGETIRFLEFSPFSLSPCSPSPAAQTRLRGVIALVPPRLPSALKLGHFSSVFPSHPPTAPSVLPLCPLLQGSCCPLVPPAEPSPGPTITTIPKPLSPRDSKRAERVSSPVPTGFFPIHVVHMHRDIAQSPCTSQATLAESLSSLSPPGLRRCPGCAETLL